MSLPAWELCVDSTQTIRWVDAASYFGLDRRRRRLASLRPRERRNVDMSGPAPLLETALRKLKLRVIDARGEKNVIEFAHLALNVAALAELNLKADASQRLSDLAYALYQRRDSDVRAMIYTFIDGLHSEIG